MIREHSQPTSAQPHSLPGLQRGRWTVLAAVLLQYVGRQAGMGQVSIRAVRVINKGVTSFKGHQIVIVHISKDSSGCRFLLS